MWLVYAVMQLRFLLRDKRQVRLLAPQDRRVRACSCCVLAGAYVVLAACGTTVRAAALACWTGAGFLPVAALLAAMGVVSESA